MSIKNKFPYRQTNSIPKPGTTLTKKMNIEKDKENKIMKEIEKGWKSSTKIYVRREEIDQLIPLIKLDLEKEMESFKALFYQESRVFLDELNVEITEINNRKFTINVKSKRDKEGQIVIYSDGEYYLGFKLKYKNEKLNVIPLTETNVSVSVYNGIMEDVLLKYYQSNGKLQNVRDIVYDTSYELFNKTGQHNLGRLYILMQYILHHLNTKSTFSHVTNHTNTSKNSTKGQTYYLKNLTPLQSSRTHHMSSEDKRTYERHTESWTVRGHWRNYRNGKKVWIKPHINGVNKESVKSKSYQL